MIAQVKDNGGTKTLEQISGSIPVGNPVGSYLCTNKQLQPRNYLYCDGSTFNENTYPALYLYLGTNVLPDCRGETEYVYIKAVDGVDISDEDTFLVTVKNFVEEKNSYSTTEMLTGGKWIDGKPIYRKVFDNGSWATSLDFDASSLNIETLIKTDVIGSDSSGGNGNRWLINSVVDNGIIFLQTSNQHIIVRNANTYKRYTIIEYTKTTD